MFISHRQKGRKAEAPRRDPVLNIRPATTRMAELVRGLDDETLEAPTPIDSTVGELLDHIQSFASAFTAAAEKAQDPSMAGPAPKPDAARLGTDWRDRIPQRLSRLATAWSEPSAWEGSTKVGGLEMPGEAAGTVALDEVILHSWDLAAASAQHYEPPADLVEGLVPFLEHMAEPGMSAAREGLFGPVVPVGEDAPLFHRVLALAGRRPGWRPS
ncbi:MAG TPA: TIGR03086 family metal-binding protein [Acidimicrobiales bacterium]|nr:TIGR03086 family metal-binding protein [Acidimicrobiales bacterium]